MVITCDFISAYGLVPSDFVSITNWFALYHSKQMAMILGSSGKGTFDPLTYHIDLNVLKIIVVM